MGYRGSGSFTHSVGDNFAFNLGVSVQRQKNAFPSFQGWGYNDGTINPGNATGDLDGDGIPNPTPWGAQTEVKKLTEDRVGVNGAIGWRVGDNFELNVDALYSKFTIDEDQNQAWYGRNGTTGNWDNGNAGCYNSAPSDYTTVGETVVAATLDELLRLGHQRDRAVHRRQGSAGRRRQRQVELGTLDHQRRPFAFGCHARPIAGRHSVPRSIPPRSTCDMSAGNTPGLVHELRSVRSRPSSRRPGWLTGTSDGPDDLEDKLTAVRLDFTREFEGKSQDVAVRRARLGSQQGLLPPPPGLHARSSRAICRRISSRATA